MSYSKSFLNFIKQAWVLDIETQNMHKPAEADLPQILVDIWPGSRASDGASRDAKRGSLRTWILQNIYVG